MSAQLLVSAEDWTADEVAQIDVRMIIGGNFSMDHLGPGWYRAMVTRVLSRPNGYLDVLERRILPRLDDEGIAALYVANLLRLAQKAEPDRVRQIARGLRKRAAVALARSARASDTHRLMILQMRFAEYDALSQ